MSAGRALLGTCLVAVGFIFGYLTGGADQAERASVSAGSECSATAGGVAAAWSLFDEADYTGTMRPYLGDEDSALVDLILTMSGQDQGASGRFDAIAVLSEHCNLATVPFDWEGRWW